MRRTTTWTTLTLATTLLLTGCATDLEPGTPPALAATDEPSATATSDDPSTDPASANDGDGADGDEEVAAEAGTALAALDELKVKGRAPKTGYDRDEFGPAWADVDHNGCDTRNDILTRDLTAVTYKDGTHECVVLTGTLAGPFTGQVIEFQRGQATSTAVQIDHVVALSDGWQKGAQQLDAETRRQFANDPLNLLAVDGPTNAAKGDGDAATWLPPHKPYRCQYVARQIAVKTTYELWVNQAEHDAMDRVLSTCPDEPLPTDGLAPTVQTTAAAEPADDPTTEPEQNPDDGTDDGQVSYANCTAVRDAGAAPIHRDDPGYGTHLDRDGDGTGCE